YVCPNGQKLTFQYHSHRTDRYGFKRKLKVYQSESCDGCPLRTFCTKAKEGNNRKLYVNETWEKQKEYIRVKLSEEETGKLYKKRKIDVEPVFGFLKANLSFSRFSVRGKSKVENELGFALMAVNLRKYTAMSNKDDYKPLANRSKKRTESKFSLIQSVFTYRRRVLKGFVPASFRVERIDLCNVEETSFSLINLSENVSALFLQYLQASCTLTVLGAAIGRSSYRSFPNRSIRDAE